MKQTGILATCERCGKTEFFADELSMSSNVLYQCSGWSGIGTKNVCPECYDEYNERRHKMDAEYWDYKKEEKNDEEI